MKLTLEQLHYHRNGVTGTPVHAVVFRDSRLGPMLGIVFPEPDHVAVFQLRLLSLGHIAFGVNSWRGDRYESFLRKAIQRHEQEVQS